MTQWPQRGEAVPGSDVSIITPEMVNAYLAVSGDTNPLHTSLELAQLAGLGGIPVPGMMIVAEMAKCVEAWPYCAGVKKMGARFVSPAIIGGNLSIAGRVLAVDEAQATALLRVNASQDGKIVMMSEVSVLISTSLMA